MPLSTKQMEYLALAWQCFDTEPKIDYEKFRQLANLASAASARELMRVTKKKLKEEYGAFQANGTSTPSATPKSAAKKTPKTNATPKANGTGSKRKSHSTTTADDMDDDEETDFLSSPTKKTRTAKSATPRIKAEPGVNGAEEDEDGELL